MKRIFFTISSIIFLSARGQEGASSPPLERKVDYKNFVQGLELSSLKSKPIDEWTQSKIYVVNKAGMCFMSQILPRTTSFFQEYSATYGIEGDDLVKRFLEFDYSTTSSMKEKTGQPLIPFQTHSIWMTDEKHRKQLSLSNIEGF